MQLINKYKNLSQPLKASVWFAICSFLQKGIQFITAPIFTRLLSPYDFGITNVYSSWFQILLIIASLSLFNGVFNVGMIKFEGNHDKYMACSQAISTITTLIFFVIYLTFQSFWNNIFNLSTAFMVLMFIQILFTPSLQYWSGKQRFDYKYRLLIFITLLISVLSPIIGIVAVKFSQHKAFAKIFSSVLVEVVISLICYIHILYKGKTVYVREYWSFIIRFAVPLIPHYLASTVLASSDRIIIDKLCGSSYVGIYSIGYTISLALTIINTSINNSFIPWTFKKMKSKEYNQISPASNIILIVIGVISVGLVILTPELVRIIAPIEYYDAIWVIPPVAMSVLFMFMYNLFGNIEFYFEANKFITLSSVLVAILNIVLNYLFIPIFGYIAAAYTTLVSYILFSVFHYLFMKRLVKLKIGQVKIYNIKFIFTLALIFISFSAIVMCLYNYPIVRYLLILALMLVAVWKRKLVLSTIKNFKS